MTLVMVSGIKVNFLGQHFDLMCVDLLPASPLPASCLYNLPHPDRELIEKYMKESLAAGIIAHPPPPLVQGCFVGLVEQTRCPCVDLQDLNSRIVKNR